MKRKTVGIIGGMGARASVRFYDEVIRFCTSKFGVQENQDFPRLLLSNLPIPDIIGTESDATLARRMIAKEGAVLERAGADCLIMACNTAHLALPDLERSVAIPVLNLIEETVSALPPAVQRVGVLATPVTLKTGLYQQALSQQGKTSILPNTEEQEQLEEAIRQAIANHDGQRERRQLMQIVTRLRKDGAQAVILGCTELGLMLQSGDVSFPLVDSVLAGAAKVARIGLGRELVTPPSQRE